MSRDATSTAGAMAPLLVAALNPSNNTAIWSHDNDEEWSEMGERERRTTALGRDRLLSNCRRTAASVVGVCRKATFYLFIYNILIFISKLCKQISFLLSKKFGRNLKTSCDALKGLLEANFQHFRQKRKLGEK
jgi:hypothetical protein